MKQTREGFEGQLQFFCATFGAELGVKYFSEGLTDGQAAMAFCLEQRKQIVRLQAEIDQLESKLRSLDTGEDEAVYWDEPEPTKRRGFGGRIRIRDQSPFDDDDNRDSE